jgi:hypothetical protein
VIPQNAPKKHWDCSIAAYTWWGLEWKNLAKETIILRHGTGVYSYVAKRCVNKTTRGREGRESRKPKFKTVNDMHVHFDSEWMASTLTGLVAEDR